MSPRKRFSWWSMRKPWNDSLSDYLVSFTPWVWCQRKWPLCEYGPLREFGMRGMSKKKRKSNLDYLAKAKNTGEKTIQQVLACRTWSTIKFHLKEFGLLFNRLCSKCLNLNLFQHGWVFFYIKLDVCYNKSMWLNCQFSQTWSVTTVYPLILVNYLFLMKHERDNNGYVLSTAENAPQ